MAQLVKNLPAMQETWVPSLDGECLLERERLPIPVFWPRKFHGLHSPWGRKESDTTERLSLSFSFFYLYTVHELTQWPGSSVHRILQAKILEWVVMPFSRYQY